MSVLPKVIYRINVIAIKILKAFSAEMEKSYKTRMGLEYPNRRTKLEDSFPDFKTSYKDGYQK